MFGLLEQASTFAEKSDLLLLTLLLLSIAFAVPVCVLIIYFGYKYRRGSKANRLNAPEGNLRLEFVWSFIPLLLALGIFTWSTIEYLGAVRPPPDATEIYVVGKQWMWMIQHPEGVRENNELHVPVNRAIKLTMTSEDVIHDFGIPAFRLKQDVLPGRYTTMWFYPTKIGEYHLFCDQYCGLDHALMVGRVIVMDQAAYESWLVSGGGVTTIAANSIGSGVAGGNVAGNAGGGQSLVQIGEQLFQGQGCAGCHLGSGKGAGPSLMGIYGQPQQLADGSSVVVDDGYIRESILNPQAKVVKGYGPPSAMPAFQGRLSEVQILQLISYMKSLGGNASGQTSAQNTGQAGGQTSSTPAGGPAGALTTPGASNTAATGPAGTARPGATQGTNGTQAANRTSAAQTATPTIDTGKIGINP